VTSLSRPPLVAAFVAGLALAGPAQAQFDPFHRQSAPPADVPGDPNQAAELVLRVNQLEEELRQANGRIEELENAEHRLEMQVQKFRQDVEYRFGDRAEGGPPAPDVAEAPPSPGEPAAPPRPRKSDAFDPNADPNAPGAPMHRGTTEPRAPLERPPHKILLAHD
jgi:TolA-binding protein